MLLLGAATVRHFWFDMGFEGASPELEKPAVSERLAALRPTESPVDPSSTGMVKKQSCDGIHTGRRRARYLGCPDMDPVKGNRWAHNKRRSRLLSSKPKEVRVTMSLSTQGSTESDEPGQWVTIVGLRF